MYVFEKCLSELALVKYFRWSQLTSFPALVSGEKSNFQFILRLLNTNVDGKQKIMYALTKIKGVGRRYSNLVCKKADVDLNKRYAPSVASDWPLSTGIRNPNVQ